MPLTASSARCSHGTALNRCTTSRRFDSASKAAGQHTLPPHTPSRYTIERALPTPRQVPPRDREIAVRGEASFFGFVGVSAAPLTRPAFASDGHGDRREAQESSLACPIFADSADRRLMARPKKSLLLRCQKRAFRARHHWRLLTSDPDLPCQSLAEIQMQARQAHDEEAIRELARSFARALGDLPPHESQLLHACNPRGVPDDPLEPDRSAPATGDAKGDETLPAVEAALDQLSADIELTAREIAEVELIRSAAKRMAEIDQRLADDGLTVYGSQRQIRPHPLLVHETSLRREIIQALREIGFRVDQRAMLERMKALSGYPVAPKQAEDRAAATEGRRPSDRGGFAT